MPVSFIHRLVPLAAGLLAFATAQFPPKPEGQTVLESKFHKGVKISYKEPHICETTPGVRSYSGYVHLPPYTLNEIGEHQPYPINTFFWFFEARKDPHNAPLSIWLNGGPGGSSMMGALAENGPCFIGRDSNSTVLNEWSWNNEVNMLYIDQPNQVGYSYGVLTNVTVDLTSDEFDEQSSTHVADFSDGVPAQNATFLVGTLGSQNDSYTANSTNHAAVALWHFAQTWFEEFPAYKPHDEKISLWTESYGGIYGPSFMAFFQRQNALIANGTISGPGTHYLHLDTLGIINGCIDALCAATSHAEFAHDNTYGIVALSGISYQQNMHAVTRPGGVADQIRACRAAASAVDPDRRGSNERANELCAAAERAQAKLHLEYLIPRAHGWYDVSHPLADPFPPSYLVGFLNQRWVQAALGTPVNFTFASEPVQRAFGDTGDMMRGGVLEKLAKLLDAGVKVALVYGDRDYACNWFGGEKSSLAVPWEGKDAFEEAGYTTFVTNPFYSGGRTRQVGNYSFTRVYQAGHMVPSYQPETAYRAFMRSLFNRDIATGSVDLTKVKEYVTDGPKDTRGIRNDVLPPPEPECYSLMKLTCEPEQVEWLKDGSAIIKDWIVTGRDESKAAAGQAVWDSKSEQQKILDREEIVPSSQEL